MPKLEIKNLHVKVADKLILNGVDLTINDGEVVGLCWVQMDTENLRF